MKNKVVIITGSASGMGQVTAYKFASNGAKVVVADFNEKGGLETVEKIKSENGIAEFIKVDVSNYDQVAKMVDFAVEKFGSLDVIWNNAGISDKYSIIEMNEKLDDYHRTISINQHGVAYGIMAAGKRMKELGVKGVIINTASVFGIVAIQNQFAYGASKAAVESMTRSGALEFGPYGIRVVAIAPGSIKTPMLQGVLAAGMEEQLKNYHMRRELLEPSDVANVVYFLASEESNIINGTVVKVDDGWTGFKSY